MRSPMERMGMRKLARISVVAAVIVTSVVLAACGGGSKSGSGANSGPSGTPVQGGTATVLETAGGVDSLDPGYWYYQTDYEDLARTTQRTLYSFTAQGNTPVPDLAQGMPTLSNGG